MLVWRLAVGRTRCVLGSGARVVCRVLQDGSAAPVAACALRSYSEEENFRSRELTGREAPTEGCLRGVVRGERTVYLASGAPHLGREPVTCAREREYSTPLPGWGGSTHTGDSVSHTPRAPVKCMF